MRLDDPCYPLKVAGKQGTKRFWIDRFTQKGCPCDIAVQDCNPLALFAGQQGCRENATTCPAEPIVFGVP